MRALAIPAVLSRIFWAKCVNGRAAGAADSLLLLNSKPGRPGSMLASTQGGPIQMDFARKYANSAHISNILSWDLINALQWLQLSFSGIYTRCSVWIINGPGNMSFLNSKSMTFITFYHFAEWIYLAGFAEFVHPLWDRISRCMTWSTFKMKLNAHICS